MSFAFGQQTVHVWGVMNVTPDSFSDGGDLKSPEDLKARLAAWLPYVDGVDIGAESTAPKNQAITLAEEKERLTEFVLPLLKDWPAELTLGLDTYRPETLDWFMSHVSSSTRVVWNDVSGQLDEAGLAVLKKRSAVRYILNFNNVPSREETSRHAQFISDVPIGKQARTFFREKFETLLRHDLFSRVIADPAFGFAKTRIQNQELLGQLPTLMEELACPNWMWGVSRKSFLRFPPEVNPQEPAIRCELDGRALLWSKFALDKLHNPHAIILRTHTPLLSRGLQAWSTLESAWNKN